MMLVFGQCAESQRVFNLQVHGLKESGVKHPNPSNSKELRDFVHTFIPWSDLHNSKKSATFASEF